MNKEELLKIHSTLALLPREELAMQLMERVVDVIELEHKIAKIKEAIQIDLDFCEKVRKNETDLDKLKDLKDLIEYDNNLLKILEGDKDGIMD